MIDLEIGKLFEYIINWLTDNFEGLFDLIGLAVTSSVTAFENLLLLLPGWIMIILFSALAYYLAKKGTAIFTLIGLFLIESMGLWEATMQTLGLVITSALIALIIGFPLGIWASKNDSVNKVIRPVLDLMQTMPAFVYLIPAVLFFKLGQVPGVIATLIFSMPPAVRLTNLGIRQVHPNIREAAISFGSTPMQMLLKVEIPTALPTILAGVNQTIMLALSMVVIAAMIGAGGLGEEVLKGLTQLKIGVGFEGGIAIVILAIFLDRITQSLGNFTKDKK